MSSAAPAEATMGSAMRAAFAPERDSLTATPIAPASTAAPPTEMDGVVTRSLTGHVTEKMRLHYSTVGLDEKRAAVVAIARLAGGGDPGGDLRPNDAPTASSIGAPTT